MMNLQKPSKHALLIVFSATLLSACFGGGGKPKSASSGKGKASDLQKPKFVKAIQKYDKASKPAVAAIDAPKPHPSAVSIRAKIQKAERSLEGNPRSLRTHLQLAKLAERAHLYKKAAISLENALLISPKNRKIQTSLIEAYLSANMPDKALPLANDIFRSHANDLLVKSNLALVLIESRRFESARKLLLEILNQDKNNIIAINHLGRLYLNQGMNELAELTFQKAKKVQPKDPKTANNLGLTYLKLDLKKEALREFDRAVDANSRAIDPRLNLAKLYLEHANYRKAAAIYREVLKVSPLHPEANINRGKALFMLGDVSASLSHYLTVQTISTRHPEANYNMGLAYQYGYKDGQKALPCYQRFVQAERGKLSKTHEVFMHMNIAKSMPPKRRPSPKSSQGGKS